MPSLPTHGVLAASSLHCLGERRVERTLTAVADLSAHLVALCPSGTNPSLFRPTSP